MTLTELTGALAAGGIEDAAWEARLLFSHFGGYAPASLVGTNPDIEDAQLSSPLSRRLAREPLQYILGEVTFCHEIYRVTPDCLIPRPDTELLVERAVELLPAGGRFADLCTGSGCIAISTLTSRTDLRADAYDISTGALALARENAERNGVSDRLTFYARDLLAHAVDGMYDAILSNPPYIPPHIIDTLAPEIAYEPRIALNGGADGMDFYRAILQWNLSHLRDTGYIFFEIGYDQADAISTLAATHHLTCRIEHDLSGNPRLAILKKQD